MSKKRKKAGKIITTLLATVAIATTAAVPAAQVLAEPDAKVAKGKWPIVSQPLAESQLKENVDIAITGNSTNPTRFQHPVMGEAFKKLFGVASGGGTGRTLHPDNMVAGPASYGMTDTMTGSQLAVLLRGQILGAVDKDLKNESTGYWNQLVNQPIGSSQLIPIVEEKVRPKTNWTTDESKWRTGTSKQESNTNSSKVSKEPVGNTLYYNGTKQKLIKSGGAFKDSKKNPMYYSLNGYTWTNDYTKITGKEVGKYTIMYGYKSGGRYIKTGTFTAEIREKAPRITSMPVAKTGLIYDGYDHNLLLYGGKLSEGQMYYKLDTDFDCGSSWSKKTTWTKNYYEIVGNAVGKYKIKIGYMDSNGEIKEFVDKYVVADISLPKVAREPEGYTNLEETGEYQKLIKTPGRFKDYKTYTMYYSLDKKKWTSDVSKITGKDAKDYTIYYGYKFGNRYITVDELEVTINEKPTITLDPISVGTIVNTGVAQQLLTSGGTLSEGDMYYRLETDGEWTTDYTKITAKDNGEYTIYLGYKLKATGKVVAFEGETVTAEIEYAECTTEPKAVVALFTGKDIALLSQGAVFTGYTAWYSVDDGAPSTEIPEKSEVGEYTIHYGYKAGEEYIEVDDVEAEITWYKNDL